MTIIGGNNMSFTQNSLIIILERLLSGNLSHQELEQIKGVISNEKIKINLISDRGVGIGGNVSNSVILTGDKITINLASINSDMTQLEQEFMQTLVQKKDPKHFCLKQNTQQVFNNATNRTDLFLDNYIKVVIVSDKEKYSFSGNNFYRHHITTYEVNTCLVIYLKANAYRTIQSLLNDLYLNYLKNQYMPYTYGQDWILTRIGTGLNYLAVPWQWLINRGENNQKERHKHNKQSYFSGNSTRAELINTPFSEFSPQIKKLHPREFGLYPNTYWHISNPRSISAVGMATSNKEIAESILNLDPENIKDILAAFAYQVNELELDNGLFFKMVPSTDLDISNFQYKFIFEDSWWWDHNNGIALIVTNKLTEK